MLSLVRKISIAALAAYAMTAQACSFYTDKKFQELAETYARCLENRAISQMSEETRLRDYVLSQNDPFLYDTLMHEGDADFGYEAEEKNRKKAAKDAMRIIGKSGAEALDKVIRGTNVSDVLIENPRFEEHDIIGDAENPYVATGEPKRERSRKLISPKFRPGTKGFRAGFDILESFSLRWKSEYDLEDSELEAKIRARILHEFFLSGTYERKIYERTESYGAGIFWRSLGATYNHDHNDDGMFLLEFNTARR